MGIDTNGNPLLPPPPRSVIPGGLFKRGWNDPVAYYLYILGYIPTWPPIKPMERLFQPGQLIFPDPEPLQIVYGMPPILPGFVYGIGRGAAVNSIERGIARLREMEARAINPDAAAAEWGYTIRIPAQKAPFNSMGKSVYRHPKTGRYITPDRTGHDPRGVWKMFDSTGKTRIGTFDGDMNCIGK